MQARYPLLYIMSQDKMRKRVLVKLLVAEDNQRLLKTLVRLLTDKGYAVEGVEDSFQQRNYGTNFGNLYKPDSMGFGGGRGNGEGFDINEFKDEDGSFDFSQMPVGNGSAPASPNEDSGNDAGAQGDATAGPNSPNPGSGGQPSGQGMPEGFDPSNKPEGFGPSNMPQMPDGANGQEAQDSGSNRPEMPGDGGFMGMPGGGGGFGMGSNDAKLQYIDDDPDSYPNIFGNAKTSVSAADEKRLIASLKNIGEGVNLESSVDIDQVLRYFVVHNYVCNSDSYTGAMTYNHYLYEDDGKLSMIPWDYNLAFGTFMSGDASSSINDAIDTPLQANGDGSLPMFDFIVNNSEYLGRYHELFAEFMQQVDIQAMIDNTEAMIAPYVEKDATAFLNLEEHEAGVSTLATFCNLRSKSVVAQLEGAIPSNDGDRTNETQLVDDQDIELSDMGSMGGAGGPGGGGFGGPPSNTGSSAAGNQPATDGETTDGNTTGNDTGGFNGPPDNDGSFPAPPDGSSGGFNVPPDGGGGSFGPPGGNGGNFGPPGTTGSPTDSNQT